METTLISQNTGKIAAVLILIFKLLYAIAIYYRCKNLPKKTSNVLTILSVPFPIITGFICLIKYKNTANGKDKIKSLIIFIVSILFLVFGAYFNAYSNNHKWIDSQGNGHKYFYESVYEDTEGNEYTYDFEKTGYDYLYKNKTDERVTTDLCYLNQEGYLHYDSDMSVTAKDESSCIDSDGTIYYPAQYTTFDENGKIIYSFNSGNFAYDRLGNAYTYEYVPYYDKEGNKYRYSFDSDTQKGTYTNLSTGEVYENEYSFVDKNSYFIYDREYSFTEHKDEQGKKTYTDKKGNVYLWASSVSWDKEGNIKNG